MKIVIGGLAALFMLGSAQAADITPKTDKEKFSYALGFQIGQSFKRDGIAVDADVLAQAIKDVMSGAKLKLSMDEMRTAFQAVQKKQQAEHAAQAKAAKEKGEAFLAANKKKPGVIELPSGVQYKIIKSGKGAQPKANGSVTANYRGTLINGEEFDSSYKRGEPATFKTNQVIPGWREILPMMHVGDKWEVFIPSNMAYGEKGAGGKIGPNETLVFEIELLKVE
jgi:FKBP-type peptidyl-prolyl cis-trans isomerase FklB